jgi:hypothetical protein
MEAILCPGIGAAADRQREYKISAMYSREYTKRMKER